MSLDIPLYVPSGITFPVDRGTKPPAWLQASKERVINIEKVARRVALLCVAGSIMATSACGGVTSQVPVEEPSATPRTVCTVLGPAPEGVFEYEQRYLPTVGDSTYVPVAGAYLVDATAPTNKERFGTMVRDLNTAFSGSLRGYPYFNITPEGLQRLSRNDFPFIFPGGEVSVIDKEVITSIIGFLECAQVGDNASYITRDENYRPPVPDQKKGDIWELLEDIFPSPLGLNPFTVPLIGGVIAEGGKMVPGDKRRHRGQAKKIKPFHHPRAYRP